MAARPADPEPTEQALEALAVRLGRSLAGASRLLATAESCTGGWVAQCVTSAPGSSAWFDRGVVCYANAAKVELLGVEASLLAAHGAVSAEAVAAMAEALLGSSQADITVAVSGVAGPGGGSAAKPVGTVWIAWAWRPASGRIESEACHFLYPGERRAIRARAVRDALEGVIARVDAGTCGDAGARRGTT